MFSLSPQGVMTAAPFNQLSLFLVRFSHSIKSMGGMTVSVPRSYQDDKNTVANSELLFVWTAVYTAYFNITRNLQWRNVFIES